MSTASPSLAHTRGFSTLAEERTLEDVPVAGMIPQWLCGSLLRTGPAKFEVGSQSMRHWFDGLAMLHRFTIASGRVSYANRYLHSRSYRAAREAERIAYSEFATDPCRSLFKRVQSIFFSSQIPDNANINIAALGQRFIAMTETALPVEFDPQTLAAARVRPYRAPGQLSTAHPHLEKATGRLINYAAKLGPRSSYRFFAIDPSSGQARVLATLPVREPAYMHSFGITPNWIVLAEFPFRVNPLRLALAGRPYIENYRWRPELGTHFTLINRNTGKASAPLQTDACFAFHHVNAFEQDEDVVVDLCTYPDPRLVEDLYLDRLRRGKPIARAALERYRLTLADGSVSRQALSEQPLELPRINYGRCNEHSYRYVWGTDTGPSGWTEKIIKIDTITGAYTVWHRPGTYPGEAVFVARPEAEREDDGVLLSVVLDSATERSRLLILNACDLTELAEATIPHHVPFNFHGHFAADSRLTTQPLHQD